MAADTFFSSGKAHSFSSGCFDVDERGVNLAGAAEDSFHVVQVRCKSGRLADQSDVGIGKNEALPGEKPDYLFQQGN